MARFAGSGILRGSTASLSSLSSSRPTTHSQRPRGNSIAGSLNWAEKGYFEGRSPQTPPPQRRTSILNDVPGAAGVRPSSQLLEAPPLQGSCDEISSRSPRPPELQLQLHRGPLDGDTKGHSPPPPAIVAWFNLPAEMITRASRAGSPGITCDESALDAAPFGCWTEGHKRTPDAFPCSETLLFRLLSSEMRPRQSDPTFSAVGVVPDCSCSETTRFRSLMSTRALVEEGSRELPTTDLSADGPSGRRGLQPPPNGYSALDCS